MSSGPEAEHSSKTYFNFKSVTLAAVAVNHISNSVSNGSNTTLRRGTRGRKLAQKCSLEDLPLIEGSSTILPQILASEGKLEELKISIEKYGLTLKETDRNECTLLHHAAATNQIAVMQYLIESGISLDAVNKDGNTALHVATINGNIKAIHLLLHSGASDTILNSKKEAPLHIAAIGTDKALIPAFLEHNSIDLVVCGYRNRTPLHIIAENDNLEGCKAFHQMIMAQDEKGHTETKFRLCATDDDGLTPIHLAARCNSHHTLDFCITKSKEHGYPSETVLGFLDEENSTPLHAAVDGGNSEVVRVLLKHGADPLALVEDMTPPLHLACSQGKLDMVKWMVEACGKEILGHLDQYSRTPLHHSALSIHSACIVTYIFQEGGSFIDLNPQDSRGYTPLQTAITSGNLSGVKELLQRGADPLICDNKGSNALHFAVWRKRKAIVELLLQLHCSLELVTTKSNDGYNPIHLALKLGYGDLVAPMISSIRFQLQNIKDSNGNNYLHLAAKSGNWKALATLLDIPDTLKLLNETTNCGITPLHCAAKAGHIRCVEILLQSGAMIHKCYCGVTPFMLACKEGHPECAKLLYEAHPFQVDWQDDCGNTALHYAARSHNPMMVKQLLETGCRLLLNNDLESFLDIIITDRDNDSATVVVRSARWQECLDFNSPTGIETMIQLIEQMPDVAMAVLDRCHKKSPLNKTHPDYWEKFNFKYISPRQCMQDSEHSPPISRDESSDQLNAGMQIRYKGSLKSTTPPIASKTKLTQSFKCKSSPTTATLLTMMEYKRVDLLIHPVVTAYLGMKWRNYGQIVYSLFCLLFLLLVILLTAFVMLVPHPAMGYSFDSSNQSSLTDNGSDPSLPPLPMSGQVIRVLALIINTIIAPVLIIRLIKAEWRTLNFVQHTPEWIFVFTVIFNYVFLLAPNPLAIWPFAAVACFFSWLSAGLMLELFTVFGIYVQMFIAITRTAFQVLVVCIFLLMAFACAFYVLAGFRFLAFSSIGYSLFTMFGYMLGEIQYDMFIVGDNSGKFQFTGDLILIFVVLVAVLMSIVMANLLIGLAVGDIERVKLNAILEKRRVEIHYYSDLDKVFFKPFFRRYNPPGFKKYPNAPVSLIRRIWREFWRSVKEDILVNDHETADAISPIHNDISTDLELIKRRLVEMSDMLSQLQDANQLHCRRKGLRASSILSFDSANSEITSDSDSFLQA